jgi:cyanophycinase
MVERMIAESGLKDGGYGIILPMSSEDQDSAVYYAKQPFNEAGAQNIYGLTFFKNKTYSKARFDSIRNAKLIYISGGDQVVFMGIAAGTDIEKAIHDAYDNGAMISGTSAGAAVMSEVMITGNELKNKDYSATFRSIRPQNLETKKGLGFITNAIIDQHFVRRSRYNRLLTALFEFPELKGIGIDESTALFVKGNQCEVVGLSQILVFENKKHARDTAQGKFGGKGIELSIYVPGEKFPLK